MRLHELAKARYLVVALITMLTVPALAVAQRSCPWPGQPTEASYTWDFPKEISGIFAEVRKNALEIRSDAAELERAVWQSDNLSWKTPAEKLARIKVNVNEMGDRLCRLAAIRRMAEPWQQEAIDRLRPDLEALASSTERALEHLRGSRTYFMTTGYRDSLRDIYDRADRLGIVAEYARTQDRLQRLDRKLQMPVGS